MIQFSILESWSLGIKSLSMTNLLLATASGGRFVVLHMIFLDKFTKLLKVSI